jgi:hypothetical protein
MSWKAVSAVRGGILDLYRIAEHYVLDPCVVLSGVETR